MKPVCLIIRDGWGINPCEDYEKEGDATKIAKTPVMTSILRKYPYSMLKCSGLDVGLAPGFQGNSEVGHINLGSGRVIDEMMVRINKSIEDNSFFSNQAFKTAIETALKNNSNLHIAGLLQNQGVHAMNTHLYALLKMAKQYGIKKEQAHIHIFSDGRDTPPQSAEKFIRELQEKITELDIGKISSLHGRYYAMDRDNRWGRIKKSYDCLAEGTGEKFDNIFKALQASYDNGVTDEFVIPCVIGNFSGIKDGDAFIHFNYRLDRARELTRAFTEENFTEFPRKKINIEYTAFSRYYANGNFNVAFDEIKNKNIFGEVISKAGLKQLRIAETEKYAHVTFFFNGQNETPFEGEDRILVPSPKVATYDLKPSMSAYEVTEKFLQAMDNYDVIILNFANGDMVGHTGVLSAAIEAVKVVDECLGKVVDAIVKKGGVALVTSDHGNCEKMKDGELPFTAHTTFDVTCSLINYPGYKLKNGRLADVAPTLLHILKIPQPADMTGENLLIKA